MNDAVLTQDDFILGRHGEVPIRRYSGSGDGPPLMWLHGGAFSHGDLDMPESDAVARAITRTGRAVVTVDYRRVPPWSWWRSPRPGVLPGVRYPVPLDDVVDVFESLQREHPGTTILLGGASAGACLAAAAALRQRAEHRPMPAALVLAYGTFHATLPVPTARLRQRLGGRHSIFQFRPGTVERMNRNYAGSLEAMIDPFAFPGGHDLRGMPPTLMLDADRDSLRASGERFASELTAAGVDVTHRVLPGSGHGFLTRPSTPSFSHGIDEIAQWFRNVDAGS